MLVHPGVGQDIFGAQPVFRLLPQQAPDQALGAGRYRVRDVELAPPDFGKQPRVLLPMEWIPARTMSKLALYAYLNELTSND